MRFKSLPFAGAVATVALAMLIAAPGASAQTADVSGSWTFEVTTDQGVTTPSLTLEQDGESLTGHYQSETLGEADVTGTVNGADITISFTTLAQGTEIPVVYAGTIDDEGVITGTIDIAAGMLGGTFTAKRSEQ